MTDQSLTAGLLTCSYRGDLEVCRTLCRTVDRFTPEWLEHLLIVPRADYALFAPLAGPRRRVIIAESLQPWWLRGLPMPGPKWRKRLFLPRREVLLSLKSLPVRGWIAQQLRKLILAAEAPWDIVLHVDSDGFFIRPLTREHLVQGGKVRLFQNPGGGYLPTHFRWHASAARLIGLPHTDYFGADYIDPFIVWRADVARGLKARIEETTGMDWVTALARTPHFAEYILYGVYADHVLGEAGHFRTNESLAFARWTGDFTGEADIAAFTGELEPHHVVCNVQSTVSLDRETRERLVEALIAKAASTA